MKRKIAAIIAADVAGYSRLVEENEEDTLRRFIAASQVFKALVQDHYGRIFNTAGDAILAEFPSPVEAVRCAAGIQTRVRELNQSQPKNRQLLFRIGVSIGDVIEHENDLLGDGVNIAARLQTLASPGGLSISHWVHEQIGGKIQLEFRDAGWHSVKNIAKPVHVFLADIGEKTEPFVVERRVEPEISKREIPRTVVVSIAAGVIAVSIAALVWQRMSARPSAEVIPAVITSPIIPKVSEPEPKLRQSIPGPTPAPTPVEAALPNAMPAPPAPPLPAAAPSSPVPATAEKPAAPGATVAKETTPTREDAPPKPSPTFSLPLPTQPQPPPNRARSAALCAEIRERAQLGDISTDERLLLRTDCK